MKKLSKRLVRSLGFEVRRVNNPVRKGAQAIHFLHIGKNAGTQVSNVSEQLNSLSATKFIIKQGHDVMLRDIPHDSPYFFSIRSPISRFRSGFYSRKRKGQPRIYSEWSAHDEIAFSEFEHANELAESLFERGERGRKAWAAMKSIRHTSQNQCDWFSCFGNFLKVRPPIWIVRQEKFEADLLKFIPLAFSDIDPLKIDLSTDEVSSHTNDYSDIPPLSQRAKENLANWYCQDVQFYDMCNEWIEKGGSF